MAMAAMMALTACGHRNNSTVGPNPVPFGSRDELKANASPGSTAVLVLAGTRVPVKVVRTQEDNDETLDLKAHDELVESESYRDTDQAFQLVVAADERFVPPIDLIRYGGHIGDSWDWTGHILNGDSPLPAKGIISTDRDVVYVGPVAISSIAVNVTLTIAAGGGLPAVQRSLKFWIAPGKGVIQREFGRQVSVRLPSAP
jgi:hypothetical protein